MTLTTSRIVSKRSRAVIFLIVLMGFLGVSAAGGSLGLLFNLGGGRPPADWLDYLPLVDSYVMPGLVLGIGFGLGSILTVYGLMRRPRWTWMGRLERVTRHHWSWIATIALGVGQVIWIGLEVLYLPALSWLQAVYGPLGLGLIVIAALPSVRGYLARPPF